jgi:hypothetical protein
MDRTTITINGKTFALFRDASIRLWTSYELDPQGNQIGPTEYAPTKRLALHSLRNPQ